MRQFRDEAGTDWKVFLTPRGSDAVSREHYLPEAYREGWLVFESSQEKRRLAPVPSDWETMPIESLVGLCAQAVPQTARARVPADTKSPAAPVEALKPQLEKAEQQLDRTLQEVCESPSAARLDTGELIRVEESLALATEAAKEAVSLRRKMHADRERATPARDESTPPKEDGGHAPR